MWKYNQTTSPDELYHHGVLGMKWGVRHSKEGYRSTSIRSSMARRKNDKVDKGFNKWKEGSSNRENAIALGKQANVSKQNYMFNKKDKELKRQFKNDNKAYKKALRTNTTYRKGQVKNEVGKDLSRSYLNDAKKIKKTIDEGTATKEDRKRYSKLMSQYDIEREQARRAPEVAANRSMKKANMKRTMTNTVKTAAVGVSVGTGVYFANKYLSKKGVSLNSQNVINYIKTGKNFLKYIY